MAKYLKLNYGKKTLVDDDIYEQYHWRKWFINKNGYAVYTTRNSREGTRTIFLHNLIMNALPKSVDHINGDPLDNRRSNLRYCTSSLNNANRRIQSNNTSGFKGVSWYSRTKKWRAYIKKDSKQISLGHYKDKIEAAKAYNEKAIELFGEFARLNHC